MILLASVLGFSVLGIPSGDTQNASDLGTGVPKTRGYPNHCDAAMEAILKSGEEKALGMKSVSSCLT